MHDMMLAAQESFRTAHNSQLMPRVEIYCCDALLIPASILLSAVPHNRRSQTHAACCKPRAQYMLTRFSKRSYMLLLSMASRHVLGQIFSTDYSEDSDIKYKKTALPE
jgi:hypothetical protein